MPAQMKDVLTDTDIAPFLNDRNRVFLELHGEKYRGWISHIKPSVSNHTINSFLICFKLLVRFQEVEKPHKKTRIILSKSKTGGSRSMLKTGISELSIPKKMATLSTKKPSLKTSLR